MPRAACGHRDSALPPLVPPASVIFSLVSLSTSSDRSTCGRGRPSTLIGSLIESHASTHLRSLYWLWQHCLPPTCLGSVTQTPVQPFIFS